MYEFVLAIVFVVIFLLDSMRMMQAVTFMSLSIIYILNDIDVVDDITFKLSALLCLVLSSMFLVINFYKEK